MRANRSAFTPRYYSNLYVPLELIKPCRVVDEDFLELRPVSDPFSQSVERFAVVFRPERLDRGWIAPVAARMRPIDPPDDAIRIGGYHGACNRRSVRIIRQLRDVIGR